MIAFVCVAFGEQYVAQQHRLKESILKIYPSANLFFWTDELPKGSKHFYDSLYGFKPHAVEYALHKGFKKIVFFDPAIILMDKIDYYETIVKDYGVLAIQDDNKLSRWCYKKATDYFNINRHRITDWHLVGGSFYYFDFNLLLCHTIFNKWIDAERKGLFGSQYDQASGKLHGHRSDEAIMALSLYSSGSKPLTGDTRYNCDGGITIKKHFK
jgi:hypothetical protein